MNQMGKVTISRPPLWIEKKDQPLDSTHPGAIWVEPMTVVKCICCMGFRGVMGYRAFG
jgi:hypothetical protein